MKSCKVCGRKRSWPTFSYYIGICLEDSTKKRCKPQDTRSLGSDSNPSLPNMEECQPLDRVIWYLRHKLQDPAVLLRTHQCGNFKSYTVWGLLPSGIRDAVYVHYGRYQRLGVPQEPAVSIFRVEEYPSTRLYGNTSQKAVNFKYKVPCWVIPTSNTHSSHLFSSPAGRGGP
jgi:hypothetical protein